jgi:WD40 repeat protein
MRLRVWDVANHRLHWDMRFSDAPAGSTFSPDGRLVVLGYENGSVEVWDVQERELLFQWRGLGAAVKRLAFTPDAAFLAYSGAQGPIHLLHLRELRRQLADMGLNW